MGAASKSLDDQVVREVCAIVEARIGVHFGDRQHSMVLGRLKRRLIELQISDLSEYRVYLNRTASEVEVLVSLLTTHYTYFFREFVQFEELEKNLPALVRSVQDRGAKRLDVLSAGCSRGQEVYSLAMHLSQHLPDVDPNMSFRIFGTDVDPESVKVAANGVYRHADIKAVPVSYLGDHWARGTKEISMFVKARKSIRDNCQFSVLNLLDLRALEGRKFDVIFCRNIFIYFTAEQVKAVTANLLHHLHPGGQIFLGLTESLHGLDLPLKSFGPSIYGRVSDQPPAKENKVVRLPARLIMPNPIRVVCIDDSPSILAILSSVFVKEEGFEVVGTAKNGEEGLRVIEQCKPDVVTLDIHMPVCDGIQFLKRYPKGQSPVVVVSSVSREDAGLAFESLQLGAFDYVEKPALNNLEQRADELKAKLKSAWRLRNSPPTLTTVDREFKKSMVISEPENCARVILFSLADLEKCQKLMTELKTSKVPVFVALEGAGNVIPGVCERLSREISCPVKPCASGENANFQLGEWQFVIGELAKRQPKRTSVMVIGEASRSSARMLPALAGAQLILEDLGDGRGTGALSEVATEVVPCTSFAYHSDEFLSRTSNGKG